MQFILATLALAATALAAATGGKEGATCKSDQQVVCKDNGNGGILTLGNVLPGALGVDCSGGDVYCCSSSDVASGLVSLNVDAQCDLNHVL
ncbi:hypothetical protein N7451_007123 [Penicillium sp. IBT 35674x]|uniref:Hydrophobin n=1 Tax=Penicillium frequentans TaxID=3151616 RepID=A0AAD6CV21_9EURO|nr:uncharacterized protein N7503_007634 [Penicillium pulvis]KAJ5537816.1 hypothetical protein N7494_007295 [Penicillium glabrum]KAJ5798338.1 hypothetical protein N7503_007634 [Penicillium pulvis]KAJ5999313.1 hypothetical protein N7451_007123 [Penicillium sp. IBT 35674x]